MDITKCANDQCPIKSQCLRWTAEPKQYMQSWSNFIPEYIDNKWVCDFLIPIKENE